MLILMVTSVFGFEFAFEIGLVVDSDVVFCVDISFSFGFWF